MWKGEIWPNLKLESHLKENNTQWPSVWFWSTREGWRGPCCSSHQDLWGHVWWVAKYINRCYRKYIRYDRLHIALTWSFYLKDIRQFFCKSKKHQSTFAVFTEENEYKKFVRIKISFLLAVYSLHKYYPNIPLAERNN